MIVLALASLLAAPPLSDVVRAEKLYYQARYEDAIRALGKDCQASSNPAECERVRAFSLAALGQEAEARAAFARMLGAEPNATLGNDVSPKLQALFKDVKRDVGALVGIELAPVSLPSEHAPWTLQLSAPPSAAVTKIIAYVAPSGSEAFQSVTLRPEGGTWVGELRPASGGVEAARYFLEVTLEGGRIVTAGSSAMPKRLPVNVGAASSGGHTDGPLEGGELGVGEQGTGLPSWAVWGIVGGVAAVVAAGVTLAVVLGGEDGKGTITVGIRFQE